MCARAGFLSVQRAYLRCVWVYLQFLGVCVCFFFILFCSTRLWLLLSKQSSARGELVAVAVSSRCLVLWASALVCNPFIKTILTFVSLCISLSVEDDHYWCSLCCSCLHPPHRHHHPDSIVGLSHRPLHPILHQLARQ